MLESELASTLNDPTLDVSINSRDCLEYKLGSFVSLLYYKDTPGIITLWWIDIQDGSEYTADYPIPDFPPTIMVNALTIFEKDFINFLLIINKEIV